MNTKVLMFGWEYPPFNSGGLGVACLGLSKALTQQGIEIAFVLPKKIDVSSPFMKIIFADNNPQSVEKIFSAYITSNQYAKLAVKYGWDNSLMDEVVKYGILAREIAKEENFDVIHAHDWLSFPAGIEAKKISGKPLIVHVHATEFDRSGEKINPQIYQIEKQGLEFADKIVAVSNYTKNKIVEKYGISPDKIEVVWNGIEPVVHQDASKPSLLKDVKDLGCKLVLFVGRITMQKGPDYFLEAAKRVLDYDKNVVFVISGSGDMENQIIRQSVELGISDKVLFTGFLRGDELDAVYNAADLFIMPSVSEPFGITALEAVNMGVPVIVSKQSGVSEALHACLRVDFWDIDEMTNKILSVLGHKSLQGCLRENGQQEIGKLSWNAAANKCVNLYEKLLNLHQANFITV